MASLIRNVFQLRLSADKPLSSVLGLAESDPRLISRNIAPVEPPSKKERIEQFKSRFSKNDLRKYTVLVVSVTNLIQHLVYIIHCRKIVSGL
ncbi:hypothetical protein DPMN_040735 [Dreissena polymorpha]|uniref:Uncharacterized protein n=1 Tax=Dreissena polymorpha TaxID=45954 RepID=A0A9D4CVK7_DREPO|nr:hypothetical protein DPMN_040735 [Dreissena polymorpha]